MAPTVRNKELVRIYESYVDTFCYERVEANIIGSFESEEVSDMVQSESRKRKTNINEARKNEKQQSTKDVSSFFAKVGTTKWCSNKRGQIDTAEWNSVIDYVLIHQIFEKINRLNFFFPNFYRDLHNQWVKALWSESEGIRFESH